MSSPAITMKIVVLLVTVFFWNAASSIPSANADEISVGDFSSYKAGSPLPKSWEPLTFKGIEKHTRYSLVNDGASIVLRAEADASASGLIREVEIDPREYPLVQWRWKVTNILEKGDVHRKSGDDYPARLYIAFELEFSKLSFFEKIKYRTAKLLYGRYPPAKVINYIWANKAAKGTMVANAFTEKAMMLVVESGGQKLNQWVQEERNVYEDYKQAFGAEPPRISGVAIMTDTDNTGEAAKAYYGDILFKSDRLSSKGR